jgi:hypothetical protein
MLRLGPRYRLLPRVVRVESLSEAVHRPADRSQVEPLAPWSDAIGKGVDDLDGDDWGVSVI